MRGTQPASNNLVTRLLQIRERSIADPLRSVAGAGQHAAAQTPARQSRLELFRYEAAGSVAIHVACLEPTFTISLIACVELSIWNWNWVPDPAACPSLYQLNEAPE